MWRTVSSAERQYVPRTSTSTPSTSKIRISVGGRFFAAGTKILEQKHRSVATQGQDQPLCHPAALVARCLSTEGPAPGQSQHADSRRAVSLLVGRWLGRGVIAVCGSLLLQFLFLLHKRFHFTARIGKDLYALLEHLSQTLFVFLGRFIDLLFQAFHIFSLGVDIPFFPGDHLVRIVDRFRVRQRRSCNVRSRLHSRRLLGVGRSIGLAILRVHVGILRSAQRSDFVVGPQFAGMGLRRRLLLRRGRRRGLLRITLSLGSGRTCHGRQNHQGYLQKQIISHLFSLSHCYLASSRNDSTLYVSVGCELLIQQLL